MSKSNLNMRDRVTLVLMFEGRRVPATDNLIRTGMVYKTGEQIDEYEGDPETGDGAFITRHELYAPSLRGRRAVKHWRQMSSRSGWYLR